MLRRCKPPLEKTQTVKERGSLTGFTIPELVTSSSLVLLVFAAVMIAYMIIDRMWKEDLVLGELTRQTSTAVEKMIRGVVGNAGLEASKSVSVPQSDRVDYTDMNDASRSFYYSNGALYSESGGVVLSNVISAAFALSGNILQIDLTTHRYVINKEIKFHIQTKATHRN